MVFSLLQSQFPTPFLTLVVFVKIVASKICVRKYLYVYSGDRFRVSGSRIPWIKVSLTDSRGWNLCTTFSLNLCSNSSPLPSRKLTYNFDFAFGTPHAIQLDSAEEESRHEVERNCAKTPDCKGRTEATTGYYGKKSTLLRSRRHRLHLGITQTRSAVTTVKKTIAVKAMKMKEWRKRWRTGG